MDKKGFINQLKFWNSNIDYLSIKRSEGAYPDALEYKDANNKDVTLVQTWDNQKGSTQQNWCCLRYANSQTFYCG